MQGSKLEGAKVKGEGDSKAERRRVIMWGYGVCLFDVTSQVVGVVFPSSCDVMWGCHAVQSAACVVVRAVWDVGLCCCGLWCCIMTSSCRLVDLCVYWPGGLNE